MKSSRVYDLPTRIFHWVFASMFIVAFTIAQTIDDDSALFSLHMIAGLILNFCILWRLVWGVIGSKYAKFSDYTLSLSAVKRYFSTILSNKNQRWRGHNPASSWAAVLMLTCGIGLGISGYLMTTQMNNEVVEEVHELLGNAFLLIVIVHIAGVIVHSMRHKDNIALSMVNGRKAMDEKDSPTDIEYTDIPSHRYVGIASLGLTILFASYLFANFNLDERKLSVAGRDFYLQEAESKAYGHAGHEEHDD